MPVLRRRQDGGYYMKGVLPELGFMTWQVTDAGVKFLRSHGIAELDTVPLQLLRVLKQTGAAYTQGSGLGPLRDLAGLVGQLDRRASLAVRFPDGGWKLGIEVMELPADVFTGPDRLDMETAARCILRLGGIDVPAMRLWPGTGSTFIDVDPQERDYSSGLVGPWPPKWQSALRDWVRPVPGLGPVAVFHGLAGGGRPLRPQEPLVAGTDYCLIRLRSRPSPLPRELKAVCLDQGPWQGCLFTMPSASSYVARLLATGLGRAVISTEWSLELVAPVPSVIDNNGIPHVTQSPLLVGLWQRSEGASDAHLILARDAHTIVTSDVVARSHPAATFMLMPVEAPGLYSVTLRSDSARPLLVRVVADQRSQAALRHGPAPLRVSASSPSFSSSARAMTSAHMLTLAAEGQAPAFAIEPDIRLDVRSSGVSGERRRGVPSGDAAKLLETFWMQAQRTGSVEIELDSGAFGRVELNFTSRWAAAQTGPQQPLASRHSRWRERTNSARTGQLSWRGWRRPTEMSGRRNPSNDDELDT